MTTQTLASRLHEAGSHQIQARADAAARPSRKLDPKRGINDRTWRTTLDTIKLLGFAQAVLVFCAGAIPSPFRLLAFLPAFALAGASVFQVVWFAVDAFERRSVRNAEVQAANTGTVQVHPEEVLSMPRSA